MKTAERDYEKLFQLSRHARTLSGISQVLGWDQETYMPLGGASQRAAEQELMAGLIHDAKTGKAFAAALSKLVDIPTGKVKVKGLSPTQAAALREWLRDYKREKALPKPFVEEFAKVTSQSIMAWRNAKKENSFGQFAPYLDRVISMERKKADYLGFDAHPYDALLDLYEPGMTVKKVESLFKPLKQSVVALLKKIQSTKQVDDSFLHGNYSEEKQIDFCKTLLKDMGYNFDHGRLDMSSHPFSSASHPTDSRITTRIHKTNSVNCISTVLHEAGHALYEMNLPQQHWGSPLGEAISLGMHESQSRWWETRIGQSKAFWHYYLPRLQKTFGGKLKSVSLDSFYRAINKVEPSFIRVDADEVTYPLHVILRFELERALIEGSLKIRDIPDAWNSKMSELLGVTPPTNREGCLQDIHWAMGGFGYFPSYTLGNLYAAHLFEAFTRRHADWEKRISKGDLSFINEWLKANIHEKGRLYRSDELLKQVTGKPFKADAYVSYLESKYKDIYKF